MGTVNDLPHKSLSPFQAQGERYKSPPLASAYRLAEDVGVVAVVIAELEFGDVQRQVFGANLMKRADDPALEDRPEPFDSVGVDRPDDVLALAMVNDAMRKFFVKTAIATPLVGTKQTDLLRDGTANERAQSVAAHILDDPRNNLTLALDGTDDGDFARSDAASPAALPALVDVPVLRKATDKRLVNLDDAHQLAKFFGREAGTHPVAHVPSRPVGAEPHHPVNLQRANAFLARQHQVDDAEPLPERLIGVLKDRAADMREAVVGPGRGASVAEPVPFHRAVRFDVRVTTARADDELGPAMFSQIEAAGILIREGRFPLADRHLMDRFWLFGSGHGGAPFRQEAA